jgi:LPXTG-motif cell wall-anchored protein
MEPTNRIARLSFAAAGLAGAAAFLLPAPAGAEVIDGNPSCADLAPEGETWIEFKIDSNPDAGQYDAGDATITVEKLDDVTVGWTSTLPVVAFIMKGGSNADVTFYDPAATSGSGSTPINENNGTNFGISHVTWCFPTDAPPVEEDPPAEEEPPAEEPPAEEPPVEDPPVTPGVVPDPVVTTTTTAPTQVLGVQLERPAAAALPRTGSGDGALAAAGALAVVAGAIAVRKGRRVEAGHFDF